MSFLDELEKTLEKALQETRQEDEARQSFEREWDKLRRQLVLPLFEQASHALTTKLHGSKAELFNGSIRLFAKWKQRESTLTLRPDRDRQVVVFESSFSDDPQESFSLEALDEETIQRKLRAFSWWVVTGRPPGEESVYDARGILTF